MKIYSPDFLKRLSAWAVAHDVHFIADEIMTGLGRTGKRLAVEWAGIKPDILCLSKGLTGGWMPFSAVLFTDAIHDLFYADYARGHSFLHSHTYSGHVLGAAVAREVLCMLEEENHLKRIREMGQLMRALLQAIADETGQLQHVRQLGAIAAADLIPDRAREIARRPGYAIFERALSLGAFLRPLGPTIYWLPPFITDDATLFDLKEITQKAIATLEKK